MKKKLTAIFLAAVAFTATAQSIVIDQGQPEKLLNYGVRLGFNASNVSNNFTSIGSAQWALNDWENGITVGAVVDFNINNCMSVQSGLYYQRRRSDFKNLHTSESIIAIEGKRTANFFQIPVLASFRMGLGKNIQGQIDFGPYFAFGFGGKVNYSVYSSIDDEVEPFEFRQDYFGDKGNYHTFDWGFKMGVGALFYDHYYVGIHYDAGARNTLNVDDATGVNKAWNFTLGYNF